MAIDDPIKGKALIKARKCPYCRTCRRIAQEASQGEEKWKAMYFQLREEIAGPEMG